MRGSKGKKGENFSLSFTLIRNSPLDDKMIKEWMIQRNKIKDLIAQEESPLRKEKRRT